MKLYYCPSCFRVYYLPKEYTYLCGRNHAPYIGSDGKVRHLAISNKTETNRPPWPIPMLSEERDLYTETTIESWLDDCPNPEDTDMSDVRRHFGYGAPGGRHLTREQVAEKYPRFVLMPVQT
ncbi:MAG TPA: hypothetical protein VLX33_02705 [Nitrososphaerales archaeon]|nr:hypothetical protein [Nitrososphaerales archaeon]